jgi:hypothetical protein
MIGQNRRAWVPRLFRKQVRNILRAKGPTVDSAKGEALVIGTPGVYLVLCCVVLFMVRPNGPTVYLLLLLGKPPYSPELRHLEALAARNVKNRFWPLARDEGTYQTNEIWANRSGGRQRVGVIKGTLRSMDQRICKVTLAWAALGA